MLYKIPPKYSSDDSLYIYDPSQLIPKKQGFVGSLTAMRVIIL